MRIEKLVIGGRIEERVCWSDFWSSHIGWGTALIILPKKVLSVVTQSHTFFVVLSGGYLRDRLDNKVLSRRYLVFYCFLHDL